MTNQGFAEREWFQQHVWARAQSMSAEQARQEAERWAAVQEDRNLATSEDNVFIVETAQRLGAPHDHFEAVCRIAQEWLIEADVRSDEERCTSPEPRKAMEQKQNQEILLEVEAETARLTERLRTARELLAGEAWYGRRLIARIASSRIDCPARSEARGLLSELDRASRSPQSRSEQANPRCE